MSELTTVLIVDDEESFCDLTKKNLEKTGEFQVLIATSGAEGIALIRLEKPDIVLLDVMMPDIDGLDVVEELKKYPQTKEIPIIFLTAIVKKVEIGVKPMRKLGQQRYIAKPVTTEELVQSINEVLEEKRLRNK